MKILGVDFGTVRIGIAVGDDVSRLAHGLEILRHISREKDAQRIVQLAEDQECGLILVGLPLDSEGEVGPRARSVLRLVDVIKQKTDLPVLTWDESHSTMDWQAAQLMSHHSVKDRRKENDHKVAALLLLDYFQSKPLGELRARE